MAIVQPRAQLATWQLYNLEKQHRRAQACGQTRFGPAVRELLDDGGTLEAEGGKKAHAEDRGY